MGRNTERMTKSIVNLGACVNKYTMKGQKKNNTQTHKASINFSGWKKYPHAKKKFRVV